MAGKPSTQFYPGDWWRSVDIRKCCMSTQGIWFNFLLVMWDEKEQGKITGTKEELCQLIGCKLCELDRFFSDCKRHKFADVTNRDKNVTIINRRMHRAFLERERAKLSMRKHRKSKRYTKVTPYSSTSSSTSLSKGEQNVTNPLQKKSKKEVWDELHGSK